MERSTRQRRAIRRVLLETRRPLSPREILELARKQVPSLGLATVYRNLRALVEEGAVVPVALPGSPCGTRRQAPGTTTTSSAGVRPGL